MICFMFSSVYLHQRATALLQHFPNALRDAILLPDVEDKEHTNLYLSLQHPGATFDQYFHQNPMFVKRHCKFQVPPPEKLYPIISELFQQYGPLEDALTGLLLFNDQAWKSAKNILSAGLPYLIVLMLGWPLQYDWPRLPWSLWPMVD